MPKTEDTGFTREIRWEVGYDHRNDPDPKQRQYGCHGMEMRWLLHGPRASVQFVVMLGWLPTWEYHGADSRMISVLPSDLGYHSDHPLYTDQGRMDCHFRPQGFCYYDGSILNATDVFKLLVTKGEEAVWERLMEDYEYVIERTDKYYQPVNQ